MIGKYLVISFGYWKKKQRHSIPRGKTTSLAAGSTPQPSLYSPPPGFRATPLPAARGIYITKTFYFYVGLKETMQDIGEYQKGGEMPRESLKQGKERSAVFLPHKRKNNLFFLKKVYILRADPRWVF